MPSSVPATTPAPAATRGGSADGGRPGGQAAAGRRRELAWRLAPIVVAALSSIAYLIVAPRTVDYAAGAYRAFLFGKEGIALWNGNWYSGHHVLGYSVLFPPFAWLLGPRLLGAISALIAAAVFGPLVQHHFGDRARWAALWFGLGATSALWSGRLPFLFGATLGLAAALALQRERRWLAILLALACGLASPVAGLFLALAMVAYAVTDLRNRWGMAAGMSAAAVLPAVLIALAFSGEGPEPFDIATFWPLPPLVFGFALLMPREQRTLRVGALLYGVACIAAYVIDSPMGGNAARLAGLVGGPLLLAMVLGRRERLNRPALAFAFVCLLGFVFVQWSPPVRDTMHAAQDPSNHASYYKPLNAFLDRAGGPPGRLEIPFTRSHFEVYEVARHHAIARGWVRQTDIARNGIFYGGALDGTTYGAWLSEHGVNWVALPDAKPDYSSYDERALIEAGLPYLKLRWRSKHWRVYQVTLPHPMVVSHGPARFDLTRMGLDDLTLRASGPGEATARITWTQFWKPDHGCVERDGQWTRVIADRAGPIHLSIDFALGRIFSRGRRCA
ncbi:MAG: hypothetical protein QOE06_2007 [Thermoleophilaceae bacterium]|nr:hypothetical protein [Thermoleophilaceae bacterium]